MRRLFLPLLLVSAAAQAQPLDPPSDVQRLVCAAAMHTLFDKYYAYVGTTGADEGLELQTFRSPDGKYANSCYLAGPQVVWRTDKSPSNSQKGRWRTHPLDEQVRWSRKADDISIAVSASNVATKSRTYAVPSLQKLSKLPK